MHVFQIATPQINFVLDSKERTVVSKVSDNLLKVIPRALFHTVTHLATPIKSDYSQL